MPTKDEIRKTNKQNRASMTIDEVRTKSRLLSKAFLDTDIYRASKNIMLYMPLGNEVDLTEVMHRARKDEKRLAFPVTDKGNGVITPYYGDEETPFIKGAYSVLEPIPDKKADAKDIDIVLVPGIAFDKSGNRIGFGKGCYDKFLKGLRTVKIGVCYDFQIAEEIKQSPHDIRMDFVITESSIINCKTE